MTDRRLCIAETGKGGWIAYVVADACEMTLDHVAGGPDAVSAFAALVRKQPWLSGAAVGDPREVDA